MSSDFEMNSPKACTASSGSVDLPGADWIESVIQGQCAEKRLPTISTAWHSEDNDLFVTLSIIAPDGKRVSKIFSRYELFNCQEDVRLQAQLKERIAHLLRFLHPDRQRHY